MLNVGKLNSNKKKRFWSLNLFPILVLRSALNPPAFFFSSMQWGGLFRRFTHETMNSQPGNLCGVSQTLPGKCTSAYGHLLHRSQLLSLSNLLWPRTLFLRHAVCWAVSHSFSLSLHTPYPNLGLISPLKWWLRL